MRNLPSNMSRQELGDASDAGKALPDLILKRDIIEAHKSAILLNQQVIVSTFRNGGFVNSSLLFQFRGAISTYWSYISDMTRLRKIENLPIGYSDYFVKLSRSDVWYCYKLADAKVSMDSRILRRLLQFCIYSATEMNLINLLFLQHNDEDVGIDSY